MTMKTLALLLTLALVGCASAQIPPPLAPKPVAQPPVQVVATVTDPTTVAVNFYKGADAGAWVYVTAIPEPTNAPLFPLYVTNNDTDPSRYYAATGVNADRAESESVGTTNGLYVLNTNPPAAPTSTRAIKKGN